MKNTEKKNTKKNSIGVKVMAGVLALLMIASVVFALVSYMNAH